MKRLLAALFLALVVALVGPLGVASADPNQDLVSGTGLFGQGNEKALLHLNAKSGPSGDDPQGTFDFKLTDLTTTFDFSGRVTCLNVHDDNHATVGGVVTKSKASGVDEGNGVWIEIEDGGPGAEDAAQLLIEETPPTECLPITLLAPVQGGNFIVHNATP